MRRTLVPALLLLSLGATAPAPSAAQVTPSPSASETPELQKLEGALTFLRGRNARDYALQAPNGIEEARYVQLGGIEQWITIRGEDRKNPVLLFLHGGPGDATNPWGYAAFRTWLGRFTVVQWDQRGAARTLARSGPGVAPTITLDRMAQDGVELAEVLRKTLGQEKILLVGHSWGSILGLFMVKARPDLFSAFVGTGQVADSTRNYAVAYTELLRKAESLGDRHALQELKDVGPPPYADGRGYGVQRKWANRFEGADTFLASTFGYALMAPGSTVKDVNDWFDGQGLSADRLVPQTSKLEMKALGGEIKVPVFVIQGAEDFTTPTRLAADLVKAIRAPHKEFVTVPGGHFAVFMSSSQFLNELVSRVLPVIRAH